MPGFASDTVGGGGTLYATNVDFTGNSLTTGSPQMVADGQLLIGSAVNPRIRVGTLGSSDSSITWTVGHGTITGQVTGGSTVVKTINNLQPNLGNITIAGTANQVSVANALSTITLSTPSTFIAPGSIKSTTTVEVGSGNLTVDAGNMAVPNSNAGLTQGVISWNSTISLYSQTILNNLFWGSGAGNGSTTGTDNIGFGLNCLNAVTSGSLNAGWGDNCLPLLTTGGSNLAIGVNAMKVAVGNTQNTALGVFALKAATSGNNNVSVGYNSLLNLVSGGSNVVVGEGAGTNYTGSESSNILIGTGVTGTAAESNVTRIGTGQSSCFISGIDGVNVGSTAKVVTEASNQLGTATITAGTGISITPSANTITIAVTGSGVVQTLTGNSGGAISPTAGNINTLGTGSITISGAGSTLTTQLTGLTNHNVLVGAGTATITNIAPSATSGVPLISQGAAADPIFGTAVVAGGGTGATTLTGILTGNGTSAFTASTVTQHGVLVGGASNAVSSTAVGSTGQVLQANTGADPTYSTATYPSTTTINQILYSSSANTVAGLATVNSSSLSTSSTGVPTWLGPMTNGQLVIGSTSATPVATTLTAGAGIAITNGAGSITIASSGGGFTWSDTSGTVTAVAANGYFITGTTTSTLPASPNEGDTVKYIVDTTNILTITAAGTQLIRIGTKVSASGGTAANTQRGDAVELVYRTVGTTWIAQDANGGWNVT